MSMENVGDGVDFNLDWSLFEEIHLSSRLSSHLVIFEVGSDFRFELFQGKRFKKSDRERSISLFSVNGFLEKGSCLYPVNFCEDDHHQIGHLASLTFV